MTENEYQVWRKRDRRKWLACVVFLVAWLGFSYWALGAEITALPQVEPGGLEINVTAFPPGRPLGPGTAVVIQISGLPAGVTPVWHEYKMDGDMLLEFNASTRLFAGTTAGPRSFIVQLPSASPARDPFAICTFQYGEVNPPPPPDPPDPPIPPTPGRIEILVLEETADTNPQRAILHLGLQKYLDSRKIPWRREDKDLTDGRTRQVPKWLEPLLADAKVKGKPLPQLVIVVRSDNGLLSVLASDPLPKTVAAAVKAVERYTKPKGAGSTGSSSFYVPTPLDVADRMLAEARPRKSEVVYDLGCGDGVLLCLAAKKYGVKCEGWELDGKLVDQARANVKALGLEDLVTIHHADLREADLSKADVILLYLDGELLSELTPKFSTLKSGTRVISHQHPLPDLVADRVVEVQSAVTGQEHGVFVLQWPPSKTRLDGPEQSTKFCKVRECDMCLGNHLMRSHRETRSRLDVVKLTNGRYDYDNLTRLHDNYHNLAQAN